ncbi:MAG: anthrax toxin-like adenylyl cyclase domain-containing protein [Pseudomonadota bacterium]
MALKNTPNEVLDLTGIPLTHQQAFQEVANAQRCIIMSRAVGTACTQLIEEGYSSKGFHIKAKSCNWGPMSGFVLEDPNLTKRRPDEVEKQQHDLEHAFKDWDAKATPLYITDARRRNLEGQGVIILAGGGSNAKVYWGKQYPGGGVGDDAHKALRSMRFVLRKTDGNTLKNAPSKDMWAVRYHDESQAVHAGSIKDSGAVYAMVNPANLGGRGAGGVRTAVTGDYDLFSLCVRRDLYRPGGVGQRGHDARMVSVPKLEKNIKAKKQDVGEDIHMGNMSPRHHDVKNALNTAFQRRGYAGGNMVHHSDEAGRPFIDDVDMPLFAVVPGQPNPWGFENLGDLREFWASWIRTGQYVAFVNPHWMSWFSFGSQGGSVFESIRAKRVG